MNHSSYSATNLKTVKNISLSKSNFKDSKAKTI